MTVNASSIIRISVDSSGNSANNIATGGVTSGDGRFVVFQSTATNLVSGDANGFFDVFLRDTLSGTTTLISTATGGTQGDNVSSVAAVTDDGRFVFFNSTATNLVGGDTNGALDVFMRDTLTGVTTRVSTASDGSQASGASQNVDVTGDGGHIGFQSTANNLVAGDSNSFSDAFVKNLQTGAVTRVSVANDGSQANGNSLVARLSDDGSRVSFVSSASNLTVNDSNGAVTDVFVRDIAAGTTTLVSVSTGGGSGDGTSYGALISGSGRYVVFTSDATNLVSGDSNGSTDVFVRDLLTNTTTRVSTATDGSQANDLSLQAVISADGRYVVFLSAANNLVQGDTNGLRDVFLKDMVTGAVTRLSVAADGSELNDISNTPSISTDGRYVTFQSQATNDGAGTDANGSGFDVFRISLVASAGADRMIGSDGNDSIDGLAGDDILNGGLGNDVLTGSAGADQLFGDLGSDTADYTASTAGVIVGLADGSGTGGHAEGDTLTGIENLTGSAFDDTLTGTDADANTLSGGDGNDMLSGLGGADNLIGGPGSDTADYTASTAGIIVNLDTGTASGGHAEGDTLASIENLFGSAFDDTLTGTDADANILNGGAGNDLLYGLGGNDTLIGGLGNNTLVGGAGDDIYIVSSTGDRVIEVTGEGRDTVRASASWTIGANIERVEFQGTANLTGNGNTLANTLGGNSGNNILRGGAGNDTLAGYLGNDRLVGGEGKDTFVFNTVLGPNNVDTITDYNVADDMIQLDKGIFFGLAAGWLSAAAFHIGTAAHDASDRIIFNSTTGGLFFDKDGIGGAAATQFATLTPGLAMTASDFFLV
ncbi:hypothetical protein AAAK29_29765 [Mesorhizobium sp. CCNWLW179-1]|uniref:beta strand repeat-containing protein n=1 Tax=unclassified Mesorhizobium TaxID=325217 RepID=UPI003014289E